MCKLVTGINIDRNKYETCPVLWFVLNTRRTEKKNFKAVCSFEFVTILSCSLPLWVQFAIFFLLQVTRWDCQDSESQILMANKNSQRTKI